jgi:hypothetical protein
MNKAGPFFLIFIISATVIFAGYDAYLLTNYGTEATVSHWIIVNSYKYPVLPFVFGLIVGFLMGHLFWRMRDTKATKEISDASRK